MRLTAFGTILVLVLSLLAIAGDTGNVEVIVGTINKIKTDAPYPFHRSKNHFWQCKIRVAYIDTDPDGEQGMEVYKAYPFVEADRWMCALPRGSHIKMTVISRGDYRGEILQLVVIE